MILKRYIALFLFVLIIASTAFTIYATVRNNSISNVYVTVSPVNKYVSVLNNINVENVSVMKTIYKECKGNYCTFYIENNDYNMSLLILEIYYENKNLTNVFALLKAPGEYSTLDNVIYIAIGPSFRNCYRSLEDDIREKFGININVTKVTNNGLYKICVVNSKICNKNDAICYIKYDRKYSSWNNLVILMPYIESYKQYILKVIY